MEIVSTRKSTPLKRSATAIAKRTACAARTHVMRFLLADTRRKPSSGAITVRSPSGMAFTASEKSTHRLISRETDKNQQRSESEHMIGPTERWK